MVVHQVDVVPVAQRAHDGVQVGVCHAGDLVVRTLQHLELAAAERRQTLVRGQGAPGHRGQQDADPRLRSSGTRAATTFSMPPYPSGGTDSHGPAFISTARVTGQPSGAFAPEIDG